MALNMLVRRTRLLGRNVLSVLKASSSSAPQPEVELENVSQESERVELDPLQHPDYFRVHELFTTQELFEAQVHLGHREGSLDSYMKPFLLGTRLGHIVFDLDLTAKLLRDALNFTAHIASRDGIIMFVCSMPQHVHLVERTAKDCQEFAHTRFWKIGNFTNSERFFHAVTRLPDLAIFINTQDTVLMQHQAVIETAKMCIPTVGIVDSNCDPRLVTYPIPGNDDTRSAIELYCKLFKEAIMRGKNLKMDRPLKLESTFPEGHE